MKTSEPRPVPGRLMLEIEDQDISNQYELLTILDGKASALLAFNSIFLASISIWLGYVPPNYLHVTLDMVFLLLLVSCFLLLQVIWLRWSRLEETSDDLDKIRKTRTTCYQGAWRISAFCIATVFAVTLVHTAGTFLQAIDQCGAPCQVFFGEAVFGNLDTK